MLSVIIPTRNAAGALAPTLAALIPAAVEGIVRQVVICDAGSHDETQAVAAEFGCDIVASPPGRGLQLTTGAKAARQPWLLFLHADTVLDPGWEREAVAFCIRADAEGMTSKRAAVFRFALDDDHAAARWLERAVAWRCAVLGLPYGDQGLLISRAFYDRLGGFRELPLMEDVDLIRRIGRRNIAYLASRAVTSAARYRREGYLLRPLRNLSCLALYFLRVPLRVVVRLYG